MPDPALLLVQQRSHKTGAQVALAHLMGHPALRDITRVLLTSDHGWLTEEVDRRPDTHTFVMQFPSSRSLPSRLIGLRLFAAQILRELNSQSLAPKVVIANDHLEALIADEMARQARCRSVVILRSSGMTKRDFFKYRCDRFDSIAAAGDDLAKKASAWAPPGRSIVAFHDGVGQDQLCDVKDKPPQFPTRILVVGSAAQSKGWQDLAAAIHILERNAEFPTLALDFTGSAEDGAEAAIGFDRHRRAQFRFIGWHTDFLGLARKYDLVISPSRRESVGLAMLETVAAGVALLASEVGIIGKLGKSAEWLYKPSDPKDLASKIENLWRNWHSIESDTAVTQERLRRFALADQALLPLVEDIRSHLSRPATTPTVGAEVVP